jgi:DNA polymerase-3 subunit gamma/tau
MLGTIDETYLIKILDALQNKDGKTLNEIAEEMGLRSMSFSLALQDLASLLHKIATAQIVPDSVLEDWPEANEIRRLAKAFTPEETQLFYQIAITSRADLSLAPDEQAGFAMALLRMLAFKPGSSGSTSVTANSAPKATAQATPKPAAAVNKSVETKPVTKSVANTASETATHTPNLNSEIKPDWHELVRHLPLRGLLQQLAHQTELVEWRDTPTTLFITLTTAMPQLATDDALARFGETLRAQYGKPVKLQLGEGKANHTIAKVDAQIYEEKKLNAEEQIAEDPFLKELEREFGAKVVSGSVRPIN